MSENTLFIAIEGKAKNWEEAIRLCGNALVDKGYCYEDFIDRCIEREKEFPTGLPSDIPVAIPHASSKNINQSSVCFLRLDKPIEFKRMDSDDETINTKLIFNLAIMDGNEHITFLQKFMQMVSDDSIVKQCETLEISKIPGFFEDVMK